MNVLRGQNLQITNVSYQTPENPTQAPTNAPENPQLHYFCCLQYDTPMASLQTARGRTEGEAGIRTEAY